VHNTKEMSSHCMTQFSGFMQCMKSVLDFQAMQRKVLCSLETMVTIYQLMWCNIPENYEASSTQCGNLKPHTLSY